jgi:transposase
VVLTSDERLELEKVVRRGTASQRDVLRARVVLLAAGGVGTCEIAKRLGVTPPTVTKWRQRAARNGIKGLVDAKRTGRRRTISEEERLGLIAVACEPLSSGSGRTTPTLDEIREKAVARDVVKEISRSHLHRILQEGDVRPHRVRMWLHSPDPDFRAKVTEICELYHNPPPGSVVLCIDEKTGMQAIERKHIDGDPRPGRDRRREFEYIRHGTQSLIAAFEVHTGTVHGVCGATRTGDNLEAFVEELATIYPDTEVHVIWDNLNIHTAMTKRWNAFNERHSLRFHFHFTPIHASWVNQIELWFGILSKRTLRNASFRSQAELRDAIFDFIERWNLSDGHPFRWTFEGYPLRAA